MNSQQVIPVPVRIAETMADEIQEMYDEITRRAYEIFQEHGGDCTLDLEDWLTAEREVLHKPDVRVEDSNRRLVVTIYIDNISMRDIQLLVTPDAMLVHGPATNGSKKVFRVVQFPRQIDVTKAEAQYGDACLVLSA